MAIRKEDALEYHDGTLDGRPGKVAVVPTKPMNTLRDLALAYSPGVAYPCLEIAADVSKVYDYTSRGNLVAVISNGTAVLGLGNIGPEASKPVMEGKAILFKRYADIDSFDIEINVTDPDEFVRVVQALEPTFGGINLEDIKAPECFEIETRLRQALRIPIMHDDQHGTAIISSAALLNAMEVTGKRLEDVRLVINGAGASAIACAGMYLAFGLRKENLVVFDTKGPLTLDRTDLNDQKRALAQPSLPYSTLAEALVGADVFVGLSKGNVVTGEMLMGMTPQPIVFALANPDPEITYDLAHAARPDVIMATGRSDYPNQVNNVLGFPFIFRGALDVRATEINEAMKMACARAIAELAREPVPELINQIYAGEVTGSRRLQFGAEYLIPKPMDPRLITRLSIAVAKAAIESGVAQHPITDWDAYHERLTHRTGSDTAFMRSIMLKAQKAPKRVVFPEADTYKVLKAVQQLVDEGICTPILLGNPNTIQKLMAEFEIDLPNVAIHNPDAEPDRLERYTDRLVARRMRKGMTRTDARRQVWARNIFGLMMLDEGDADALVTGLTRSYRDYLKPALDIVGLEPNVRTASGLYILRSDKDLYFFADTTVCREPSEEQLLDIIRLTVRTIRQFGVTPRVAMLSYANFGSNRDPLNERVASAARRIQAEMPDLIIDGEIQANFALRPDLMQEFFPFNALAKTGANTFIFPNLAAANIAYKLLQEIGQLEAAGPILMGLNKPVYILQMGSSVREIVHLTALAVHEAQRR
jgi:malate dehydrogenase (oxaloacetate-decarboxylating)(NADP+)